MTGMRHSKGAGVVSMSRRHRDERDIMFQNRSHFYYGNNFKKNKK